MLIYLFIYFSIMLAFVYSLQLIKLLPLNQFFFIFIFGFNYTKVIYLNIIFITFYYWIIFLIYFH